VIVAENFDIQEVGLYDSRGGQIGLWVPERVGPSTFRIRTSRTLASGVFFMMLRGRNKIMYKQLSVIK
jgi:hypothetical protein